MICVIASLLILVGAGAESVSLMAPAGSAEYHSYVRKVGRDLPLTIGNWAAREVPLPEVALKVLRPNLVISRRYTNAMNGLECSVLLIQCADARDLVGHYPPVCYPGQGWKLIRDQAKDWASDPKPVCGMEYEFSRIKLESDSGIYVANTMIFPDGGFGRNMDDLFAVAYTAHKRHFGAAQLQIVIDQNVPADERNQFVAQMLSIHRPVIDAIQMGSPSDAQASQQAVLIGID